jgi:8-oxo-dGTP pyrophosphatase MutT (NUDIX family)
VVVRQNKLLLAFSNNKQAWYLPGGKVDKNETSFTALICEIKEELNIELQENELKFYAHIAPSAFGEMNGMVMEQDCFLCGRDAILYPSAEISDVKYFDSMSYSLEPGQVPGVVMILAILKNDGMAD